MAKIEQGILGGFIGRVGMVVGYRRKGLWCVRTHVPHIKDRKSAPQLQQRSRFKTMIQFSSPATPVLRAGLRAEADRQGLTEGNTFLRLNHECFSGESGTHGINYPALRFSLGTLAAPRRLQYTVDERGAIAVSWSADGGRLTDRIHIYIYSPAAATGVCAAAERGRRRTQLLMPQNFASGDLHVWAFAEGVGGEVSETRYAAAAADDPAQPRQSTGNESSESNLSTRISAPAAPSWSADWLP